MELRIETGAIVWQSSRIEEYQYDAVYGHDIVIPGVNWTHACLSHNLPLIQAYEAENIRVTGGGTFVLWILAANVGMEWTVVRSGRGVPPEFM